MIRLSEIKLSLAQAEHPEATLRSAAARILEVPPGAILGIDVFKRSFDARKAELVAVYIVDVTLDDPAREAALLAAALAAARPHVAATPDMHWPPPVQSTTSQPLRPIVVGF